MKVDVLKHVKTPARTALLTGASGRIGQPLALALARAGWRLILMGRDEQKLQMLKGKLPKGGAEHAIIVADFEKADEIRNRLSVIQSGEVSLFVHLASPAMVEQSALHDSGYFEKMMRVNYSAFLELAQMILPGMLAMQHGTIVAMLSDAIVSPSRCKSATFAGAKMALAGAVAMLADRCEQTGMRWVGFAPGESDVEKVIEALMLDIEKADVLANGWGHVLGRGERKEPLSPWGNSAKANVIKAQAGEVPASVVDSQKAAAQAAMERANAEANRMLGGIFRRVFELGEDVDLDECRWGTVANWDSLGQLKLLMEVEQAFEVSLPADFVVKVSSYEELRKYLTSLRK